MKNRERQLCIISTFCVIFLIVPLLLATYYVVPAADDFSNSSVVLERSDSILKSATLLTAEEYFSWQGTVSATFLLYAASPMLRGGVLGIRIGCAAIVLIYIGSEYFLISGIVKYIFEENRLYIIHLIYCIVILFATLGRYVGEALYWFCGGMVHTLPFSFCMLGIGFTIRMLKSQKKKKKMILAVICMLIAAGGSLQVAAACNVALLGILLLDWEKREERKSIIIVFASAFLMALLNAAAPGNFARHGQIDEECRLVSAIRWAIQSEIGGIEFLLFETPLIIFLLFAVVLGYQYGNRIQLRIRKVIFCTVYMMLGIAVTNFPVTLGYSKAELPDRCQFLQNNIIILVLVILTVLWGTVIAQYDWKAIQCSAIRRTCVAFGTLIFVYLLGRTSETWVRDYTPFNIWINYVNGNLEAYDEAYDRVFYLLENGKGQDVLIDYIPDDMNILHSIGIEKNLSFWINGAVANYYGCESVSMRPQE